MNPDRKMRWLFVILVVAALWQFGLAGWIVAKAVVAQVLLDRSWQQTLIDQQPVKPWPWADTWPVAELIVPTLDIERIVLAGDSGATLAFGPGHSFASVMPEQHGTVMISGHRDTHFRFLQNIKQGERLILKTMTGIHYYTVNKTGVVDSQSFAVDSHNDELLLVTCYPFNSAITGGNERYLVFAQREQV